METKPKQKLCKRCWKYFVQYNSLQKTCSETCLRKLKEEKEKEKRKIQREKKAVSVSALSKKADTLFSEYVRKRDFKKYGSCVTCGQQLTYEKTQCGHFVTRARKATRWNKKNASGQCAACNCWWGWRQYEHGIELDKRWWSWTAQEMLSLSNSDFKLTSEYLQEVILFYRNSLEEL